MGRPVNSKWMGADDSDSQFLVLARIPGQSAAECVIVRQKTAKSFIVALDSDINTQGVCTLVNKKEANNALNTDAPNALNEGEMIMNCKLHGGALRRVMRIMNRTLIYSSDNSPGTQADAESPADGTLVRAKWSFSASDLAQDPDVSGTTDPALAGKYALPTVQLEEAAMANSLSDFETDG